MIFQIILAVIAFKRGWRWLVFIPLGIAFVLGLMSGVVFFEDESAMNTACFIADAVCFISLGLMIIKPKR